MLKVKALRVEVVLEDEEQPRRIIDWKNDDLGTLTVDEFSLSRGFNTAEDTEGKKVMRPTGEISFVLGVRKVGPEGTIVQ